MADVPIRDYKDDPSTLVDNPRRVARIIHLGESARLTGMRAGTRYRVVEQPLDYAVFKATITSAVEEIKQEIHDQHDQTRAAVHTARQDILAAVKESPTEYVKLVCEFGTIFLLFCLAIRFALQIELVNTMFGFFMLFALCLYWAMAHQKQKSGNREGDAR